MAIPPFPLQELAKLVLGYLAEEQLMTAYDEFLQASPYLDAMGNEYDRIFMTSLKNILAEYRAVKIYVENCKPLLLRRKLFQCANLLEVVKLLVNHIDVNQLSTKEIEVETSSVNICTTNLLKFSACEVCNSLKLSSCICKTKQNQQKMSNSLPMIYQDETSLVNSVETTSLADLPGSHIKNRKKPIKVPNKGCTFIQTYSSLSSEQSSKQSQEIISNNSECYSNVPIVENIQQPLQINGDCDTKDLGSHVTQSKQKIDELNYGLGTVCNKTVRDKKQKKLKHTNKNGTTPTSFQDFASGVRGGEYQNGIIPDSSTSENTNVLSYQNNRKCENVGGTPKPQLFLKIEAVRHDLSTKDNEAMNSVNNYPYMRIKPVDQKVKILSNVKVDNIYKSNDKKKTSITNNATSTPMMKMQSVVINGTPAYRTQFIQTHQQTFSKDEIMAMPTIIVVPTSGGQQIIPQAQPVTSLTAGTTTTQFNATGKLLSPLIIDITSPTEKVNSSESKFTKETSEKANDIGLVKTIDALTQLKNNSAPKDIVTSLVDNSTPQVIPLTKKSSSTPRRTSHIRVLDFTTPRKILQETINQQASNENHDSPSEAIPTTNFITEIRTVNDVITDNNIEKQGESNSDIVSDKQQNKSEKLTFPMKASWDSKLRVMVASDNEMCYSKASTNNPTSRISNNTNDTKSKETNKLRKSKKIKNKPVSKDDEPEQVAKSEVIKIKPTIHIKAGPDRISASAYVNKKESEDNRDKLMEQERINTPEVDRVTLQNVMGAKLNISELLETPYKQVFYDIQMETPRCLVPDLPGEPMSDFKIMNIPTPRFFDSPKIMSATPSYSSRPTDYSSGGSYYKPDDQDFVPSTDLKCVVTSTKDDIKSEMIKDNSSNNKKKSRPIRKCAKNVSYYNISKMKEYEDKTDTASSCSESANAKIIDSKNEKENLKVSQDISSDVSEPKPEKKKSSRKRKSPTTKEKPKSFMKIKPRRVTPTKDSLSGRIRKKTFQSTSPKLQRKRTTSKEKNINEIPAVICVPTKSRRKSSTPRKLHCSKTFNSSSVNDSVDVNKVSSITRDTNSLSNQDSDVDQLALRWSDDGSQEVKNVEDETNVANDSEDISKIQEYLETTVLYSSKETGGVFQDDLMKRSFDVETARIIERDLLDTPPQNDINRTVIEQPKKSAGLTNNTLENTLETASSVTSELKIVQCDDDNDEIELSLHECNEDTNNFVVFEYNDTKETPARSPYTLKDKFSMEVCIDDLTIRLRATSFTLLYDFNQNSDEQGCNTKETEEAVNSILTMDKLYTPLKPSVRDQVYDIFDSTLTSLDTPLKNNSPKKVVSEVTVNAIVLEEEETEINEKVAQQKRKRRQSDCSDESLKDNKKAKSDAQYLLSSANIQNIDIETVLKKLHGP